MGVQGAQPQASRQKPKYYPPSPERKERTRRQALQQREIRKEQRVFIEQCIKEGARVRELDK